MAIDELTHAIKSPSLKQVLHHWMDARGTRRLPGWKHIRPSRIALQLPVVWSYTYDAQNQSFTGRLAGDRIEATFGRSFRGTPMAEIFHASAFDAVYQRARRVVDEPAAVRSEGVVCSKLEKIAYGERIILPVAADGTHPDGLLGATDYRAYQQLYDGERPEIEDWYPL